MMTTETTLHTKTTSTGDDFDQGQNLARDNARKEAEKYGHTKQPIMKVIRNNCIECVGGQSSLVKECEITRCVMWPYRMGKNPFSNRTGNPNALRKAVEAAE